MTVQPRPASDTVPLWQRCEIALRSDLEYREPLHECALDVELVAPSGRVRVVPGFWDGGRDWKVRFLADEIGTWTWRARASARGDAGLHDRSGAVRCAAPSGDDRFARHGRVRLSADRLSLAHADGTPFLWLGDTAWNGPLLATDDEWEHYCATRAAQGFTAVQWVATNWVAAPEGDRDGRRAWTGRDRIAVDPLFFRRIERRSAALARHGLLSAPVLLWTVGAQRADSPDPGTSLPEDQLALLARYEVARLGGDHVAWLPMGDGDYRGAASERWKRIMRRLFAGDPGRAPTLIHPCGMGWVEDDLADEPWVDVIGYQSGHGDDERTFRWLVQGPPASDRPARRAARINLEPPYEEHLGYQSRTPLTTDTVRRALWWSLLVHPTAGVTYGGHGVWGWDDGTRPPTGHASTGIARPWREALMMAGAEQIRHIAAILGALPWPRLRPCPELIAEQPGLADVAAFTVAARTDAGDAALVYAPRGEVVTRAGLVRADAPARWRDPRTGASSAAQPSAVGDRLRWRAPIAGDAVLTFG